MDEPQTTTSSSSSGIPCPVCKTSMTDLWDHDWGNSESIETCCGHCEAKITLSRVISVDYTCRPGWAPRTRGEPRLAPGSSG